METYEIQRCWNLVSENCISGILINYHQISISHKEREVELAEKLPHFLITPQQFRDRSSVIVLFHGISCSWEKLRHLWQMQLVRRFFICLPNNQHVKRFRFKVNRLVLLFEMENSKKIRFWTSSKYRLSNTLVRLHNSRDIDVRRRGETEKFFVRVVNWLTNWPKMYFWHRRCCYDGWQMLFLMKSFNALKTIYRETYKKSTKTILEQQFFAFKRRIKMFSYICCKIYLETSNKC